MRVWFEYFMVIIDEFSNPIGNTTGNLLIFQMGRQVNFYLHPDDQTEFDAMLKSRGEIAIVSYYHNSNKISMVPDTLIRDATQEGSRVYLVRPQDLQELRLKYFEKRDLWLIDENQLPVLHFDRCTYNQNKLDRGRLYFQPKYVKDLQWIDKPQEFVKWADSLISKARQKLEKRKYTSGKWTYMDYVGRHAFSWIQENNPEMVLGGMSLKF